MTIAPLSIGKLLALIAFILAIVFLATGSLTLVVGGLLALLALSVVLF